jgi:hypothetical protein
MLQRFAVPCASICLFAYLLIFAHFALVPHGFCLEHGEVVDLDVHAEAHTASAASHEISDLGIARAEEGYASSEGHDHCFLAHELGNQNKVPAETVAVVAVSQPLPPTQSDGQQHASLVVYELAPKTSPPLA